MQQLSTTIEKYIDIKDFKTLERLLHTKIDQHEKQFRKQNIKIYSERACNIMLNSRAVQNLSTEEWLHKAQKSVPPIIMQEILQAMEYFNFNDTSDACLFKKIVIDRFIHGGRFTDNMCSIASVEMKMDKIVNNNEYQLPGTNQKTLFYRVMEFRMSRCDPQLFVNRYAKQEFDWQELENTVKETVEAYKRYYVECEMTCEALLNKNKNGQSDCNWCCYKCGSINCDDKDDYCKKCNQGVNPLLFPRMNKSTDFGITKPFGLVRIKVSKMHFFFFFLPVLAFNCLPLLS